MNMTTKPAPRAAIYCRMSLSKGEVKIEQQEAMGRAIASSAGYDVAEVYVDDGINAYAFKDRPGWSDLLADIEAGRVDMVLAQSEDRFTRQVMEKETLGLLCAAHGVRWHTTNDGLTDPATSDGEFMSTLRAALGRQESHRKSERMRQANAAVLAKGKPLTNGTRPFGYAEDKVTLLSDEADMIRQGYAWWNSDAKGLAAIAKAWNATGVKTVRGSDWNVSNVRMLLERGRNAGLVWHHGGYLSDVKGQWEPIVDEETYRLAVAKFESRATGRRQREPKTLLNMIAKCVCGEPMRPTGPKDARKYRCRTLDQRTTSDTTQHHTSIREKDLDPIVAGAMVSALFLGSATDTGTETGALAALYASLSDVKAQVGRLVEAVMSGALSGADVAAKRAELTAEEKAIQSQIDTLTASNAKAAMLDEMRSSLFMGETVDLVKAAEVKARVRERFDTLDLGDKRALIRSSLDITVHPGRKAADRVEIASK